MKNRKLSSLLIAICSCITLISVGFASWTIVNSSSSASGNITAEDVIYSDDYIRVSKKQKLTFIQDSFVNNNTKVNNSSLVLNVELFNLQQFKTKYANSNNLYIDIKFTSNIIDNKLVLNKPIINSGNSIKPSAIQDIKLQNGYNTKFDLNNVLNSNNYVFNINYNFVFNGTNSEFKTTYFNKLVVQDLFNFNISIFSK